ncbi:PQQ-like domain-containing protein [Streptomyces sp. TLI_053]|uniref:outer membrane protein assembly factor BamB family protein n=1 Tax=Streptomyces sp. TLI_053 TaxID=1855352 RepID=UPI00087A5158|nr:PQQ-binding-like beta-propeller repeat protein [Streptomyces sp. TLI_053]SDT82380.1 PQQ-like domain-containing protein [Streptomyces sp. TLI_053]
MNRTAPGPRPARRLPRAAALLTGLALLAPLAVGTARADVTTISFGNDRTAWDRAEPLLDPTEVDRSDFGVRFSTQLDGQVFAQPLVIGDTVVVATETNHVYGVDARSGKIVWHRETGPAWASAAIGCSDPGPNVGTTSTPVYDPATGTVYLTSKVDDGPDDHHPHHYVHALDARTGAERSGWPVTVQGEPVNAPGKPFNAYRSLQRPGLLLLDGRLYFGFGSLCGIGDYIGTVAGLDTRTRRLTLFSTVAGSDTQRASVWMSGSGLVSDGPGRFFLTTANGQGAGASPAPGPGNRPPGGLGESVVRFAVDADGGFAPADFFSPTNNATLDKKDTDLGSGGPVALPSGFGTAAHPHLLVQVGKDGRIFLLDRDDLGGTGQGPNGTDKVVGLTGPFGGVWGHPAVWGGDGGYVYTVENYGKLRALKYGVSAAGTPQLSSAGTSAEDFLKMSGSPVVTSDGTRTGSALVWVIWSGTGKYGEGGELRAYDPVPVGGTLKLRRSVPIGTVSKFSVPATDKGRIYIGTKDHRLVALGRPGAFA